tara:strand:- start:55 stop:369 length:315 start_codon:yes stop_codon:yes gene_type:complete
MSLVEITTDSLEDSTLILNAGLTDARYLEMADDMKRVVDNKDSEVEKYKREARDLKKAILKSYGIVVYVQDVLEKIDMEELFPVDLPLCDLLEVVRGNLEKKIL